MSFSFGFTLDDVSDDELTAPSQTVPTKQAVQETSAPEKPPQLHSLSDVLSTLKHIRISFDNYTTPQGNVIYRRELFDIKHQAMTEEEGDLSRPIHDVLLGDQGLDIQRNVYEGGFKLWECSYDLVDLIRARDYMQDKLIFLDMGCGSGLPSCFLFLHLLTRGTPLKLILADFNYEVLRLVTLPNLLIHWASTIPLEQLYALQNPDTTPKNDEFEVTEALIEKFLLDLSSKNVEISFISGSWGHNFASLLSSSIPDCILSSETIYSPETLPIFVETLLTLIGKNTTAYVAAKHYYFGVGGSVKDFCDFLVLHTDIRYTVVQVPGQLKRAIVEVTRA